MKEKNPYEDIIHLSRPVSQNHPPMPRADRAAQFSPFAALTGYDAVIRETARLTGEKTELGEQELEELNQKLRKLLEHIRERPEVDITYFQPDVHKAGGAYRTLRGRVRKVNEYEQYVLMEDGRKLSFENIAEIAEIAEKNQQQGNWKNRDAE